MARNSKAEVVASTFDEQASRHVKVAEMVLDKAKRMVEMRPRRGDLPRLRSPVWPAPTTTVQPASGKVLSGGVDANALHKPKRFFGAARNTEEKRFADDHRHGADRHRIEDGRGDFRGV